MSSEDGVALVHGDDPSCGAPAGNSHRVIGGTGTPTLTLDATGLAPHELLGFVSSAERSTPSGPVGCTAVAIS